MLQILSINYLFTKLGSINSNVDKVAYLMDCFALSLCASYLMAWRKYSTACSYLYEDKQINVKHSVKIHYFAHIVTLSRKGKSKNNRMLHYPTVP